MTSVLRLDITFDSDPGSPGTTSDDMDRLTTWLSEQGHRFGVREWEVASVDTLPAPGITEAERIFDDGRSGSWIVYDIATGGDGARHVEMGTYWYTAEEDRYADSGLGSRRVDESVDFTMDEWLAMRSVGIDPQTTERYDRRPGDWLEDLTYEEARAAFAEAYDTLPHLDMPAIGRGTPDGRYIGRFRA